jgi:hypothetical protein
MSRIVIVFIFLFSLVAQTLPGASVKWRSLSGLPTRFLHGAVNYDGYLWVIGGQCSGNNARNDVWRSQDGMKWDCVATTTPISIRASHSAIVFQNRIWVIGGTEWRGQPYSTNDAWSSGDGRNWRLEGQGAFAQRAGHGCVVFKNELYVVGGGNSEVWKCDGTTWSLVTADAGFGPRQGIACIVFAGKIWAIGGYIYENHHNTYLKDAWSSSDGITWTKEVPLLPFSPNDGAQPFIFQNRLWLLNGGGFGAVNPWSVWSTADGINWQQELRSLPEATMSGARLSLFNGRMWITGGLLTGGASYYNGLGTISAWVSDNGIEWSRVAPQQYLPIRTDAAACIHNEAMWQIGGSDNRFSYKDVYRSENGENWQLVKGNPPFAQRYLAAACSFKGSLFLAGGYCDDHQYNPIPNRDIWRTTDGLSWDLVTTGTPFLVEGPSNMQVFGEKLWVIESDNAQKAWSSDDGVSWTLRAEALPFGNRRFPALAVWKNKLWLSGGDYNNGSSCYSDLWATTDGLHWQSQAIVGSALTRSHHAMAATSDRLLLFNGDAWPDKQFRKTVSYTEDGVHWVDVTAPYYQRDGHTVHWFHDQLYVIGGNAYESMDYTKYTFVFCQPFDDTWVSEDQGLHWRMLTRYPAPPARMEPILMDSLGKLYYLGGYLDGLPASVSRIYLDDLWTSADGQNWEMLNASLLPINNPILATAFLNDRLYFLSGYASTQLFTSSGTLTTQLSTRNFPTSNVKLVAFKNKLHVFSMPSTTRIKDEITTDGTSWEVTTSTLPSMSTIGEFYTFNDRLAMTMPFTDYVLALSENGANWELVAATDNPTVNVSTVVNNRLFAVAYNENGYTVSNRRIVSSADGKNWKFEFIDEPDYYYCEMLGWQDRLLKYQTYHPRFELWIAEPPERSGAGGWALYQ